MEADYEVPHYVERSIDSLRKELMDTLPKIHLDDDLRDYVTEIVDACRVYMNKTGSYHHTRQTELQVLRNRVGVLLARLSRDYACVLPGELNGILPPPRSPV